MPPSPCASESCHRRSLTSILSPLTSILSPAGGEEGARREAVGR